jgi:MFS family permease
MMVIFFVGLGLASILIAFTNTPLQLAFAMAVLGCATSIYHPVGIPMLVQGSERPGWTIGVNGFAGNLGLAMAAVVTGLMVKYFGWRMAFVIPGILSVLCGLLFALYAPRESMAPAKKKPAAGSHDGISVPKLLLIMTVASSSGSMLFNFSTNSDYELLTSKFSTTDFTGPRDDRFVSGCGVCPGIVYPTLQSATCLTEWRSKRFFDQSSSCSSSHCILSQYHRRLVFLWRTTAVHGCYFWSHTLQRMP